MKLRWRYSRTRKHDFRMWKTSSGGLILHFAQQREYNNYLPYPYSNEVDKLFSSVVHQRPDAITGELPQQSKTQISLFEIDS